MPRKAHLLLVDDDPNTLASLSRAFRLAGHEATVCDNAPRALELLRAESFDLILSDVVMPGKSGIELLEDLKQAGVKTPIVLISGQANVEMAVKATKLGALDFLGKAALDGQTARHRGKRDCGFRASKTKTASCVTGWESTNSLDRDRQ